MDKASNDPCMLIPCCKDPQGDVVYNYSVPAGLPVKRMAGAGTHDDKYIVELEGVGTRLFIGAANRDWPATARVEERLSAVARAACEQTVGRAELGGEVDIEGLRELAREGSKAGGPRDLGHAPRERRVDLHVSVLGCKLVT